MSRILFVPLSNPDGVEFFDEDDADVVVSLESGAFTALYPGHGWQRRLYVVGRRFVEGVLTTGLKHPDHTKRKVPFVEVSGHDAAVSCAKYSIDPPDAVIASLSDSAAGTPDPSSDASTTPGTTGIEPDSNELQPDDLGNTLVCLLQAAASLHAFNAMTGKPLPEITKKAGYPSEGARNVRDAMDELKKNGLMKAKAGRGGCHWITEKGLHYISR